MTEAIKSAAETRETCRNMLQDEDGDVRLQGLAALSPDHIDPAPLLEEIGCCLHDTDGGIRLLAVNILAKTPRAVRLLIAATLPEQPLTVRMAAIAALGRMKDKAKPAVGTLVGYLGAEEKDLRLNTVIALRGIGKPAVPQLIGCLGTENEVVQTGAIDALGWLGPKATEAVQHLKAGVQNLALPTRLAAFSALIQITGNPAEGLPALLQELGHPDYRIRQICIERIGEAGESAAEAIPNLLPCLQDAAGDVRAATVLALVRIKPQCREAVPPLIMLLKDREIDARANAAMALATIGPAAQEALPGLTALLQDPDARISGLAAAAIRTIQGQP